jgi:hypothetical protein
MTADALEWVLVVTLFALGPQPVAIKSYPDRSQCQLAIRLMDQTRVRGECIQILLPRGMKGVDHDNSR